MEVYRVEPTDPLAPVAAPFVRAMLGSGRRMVAVFGKRDPAGYHPAAVHAILVAPEGHAEGYTDAAEWLRQYEAAK